MADGMMGGVENCDQRKVTEGRAGRGSVLLHFLRAQYEEEK